MSWAGSFGRAKAPAVLVLMSIALLATAWIRPLMLPDEGRYVGVAPEEADADFDFEETIQDIHLELAGLDAEAVQLAAVIQRNFLELGI